MSTEKNKSEYAVKDVPLLTNVEHRLNNILERLSHKTTILQDLVRKIDGKIFCEGKLMEKDFAELDESFNESSDRKLTEIELYIDELDKIENRLRNII